MIFFEPVRSLVHDVYVIVFQSVVFGGKKKMKIYYCLRKLQTFVGILCRTMQIIWGCEDILPC